MGQKYLKHLYSLLHQYTENLHKLEMMEANTGGQASVDLQNQIQSTEAKIEELIGEIAKLRNMSTASAPGQRFGTFLDWPPFKYYAGDARRIFVSGGSLDNLIQIFGQFLVEKAEDGCDVRLVLMDPHSPAIPQVEKWSDPNLEQHPNYYRRAICRSLRRLANIDVGRSLKIALNPTIPALTVVILEPIGKIRVDIQPFQAVVAERPVLELNRQEKEDEKWYELFYRQYSERLWSAAIPVDLDNLQLPPECR